MKIGKVPENVLKRSVFKQIHTKRPEVVLGAGVGEDCAAVKLAEDETLVMSTDPITGTAQDIGTLAIQILPVPGQSRSAFCLLSCFHRRLKSLI